MTNRPEPDDVELFVGGVEPDATASDATAKAIVDYKKRPDYPSEAEAAERILAANGINGIDYGIQDPKSMLEHWHECVEGLQKANLAETNGTGGKKADTGVPANFPSGQEKEGI